MTVGLLMAICTKHFPPFSYGFGQCLEDFLCSIPSYTSICNTDTVLQASFTLHGDLLSAYVDVSP